MSSKLSNTQEVRKLLESDMISPSPKTDQQIEWLKEKSKGKVKVMCLSEVPLSSIPPEHEQRLLEIDKEVLLILPESIIQVPVMMSLSIGDYVRNLECLDYHQRFDNFVVVFRGLIQKVEECLPFEHKYITSNSIEFRNRLFGAGSPPFSKVIDETVRQQLIDDLDPSASEYYPDEKNSNYSYSMLFYCPYKYPPNLLNDPNFELNWESISSIFEILERVIDNMNNQKEHSGVYCKPKEKYTRRLINILFENPQTSELIQIKKYRELASLRSKAIAFHFQLVGEQMGKKWKRPIPTWTPEKTLGLENVESFEELWFLHQIPDNKIRQSFCLRGNQLKRLPTLEQIEDRFNNFSQYLISERRNEFIEPFFENLLISGSIFAYAASFPPPEEDNLTAYSQSDIDCPILAGDGVFLSVLELKEIALQKLQLLQKYFPSGYRFQLKQIESRWQITNKANKIVLELYSIPFSLETCPVHFANYHLGQVRGYLRFIPGDDGFGKLDVQLLPSAVPSLITRMSLDFRFASTKRPPQSIVHKYMERSFGVFLNRREQECLDLYLMRTLNRTRYEISRTLYRKICSFTGRPIKLLPPCFGLKLTCQKSSRYLREYLWDDLPLNKRFEFVNNQVFIVSGLSDCRKFVMTSDGLWVPISCTNFS